MNPVAFIPPALLGLTLALPLQAEGDGTGPETPDATQESTQAAMQGGAVLEANQRQAQLDKRFEKARILERVERNPKAAADLYRSLTMASGSSKEFQGQCWLRLGICLDQLGEKEKAKLAYEKAATSSALVAAEAKARMQGQDPKRFEYRVRLQIDKLIHGKDLAAARRDLLWIGEESVPYLIAAIEDEKLNLDFVVRATDILLALGGPETIAFLERSSKSEDTLLRRALVRGFTSKVGPDLAKAMSLYLEDPDPRTRDEALRRLISVVPTSTILGFLEKGPESIQGYLISRFRNAPNSTAPMLSRSSMWNWDYQSADATQNEIRLLKLYQQWYGKEIPTFFRKGSKIVRDHILWSQLLRRPQGWAALAKIVNNADNNNQLPNFLTWSKETAPSPGQFLELARSLPAYPVNQPSNQPYEERMRQEWVSAQLRALIVPNSKPSAPLVRHDFLEIVPELAALRYDVQGMLSKAIQELGQAKDLRMAVELIPKLHSTQHLVWISKQTPGVDLLPVYQKSLGYMWEQRKTKGNRFTNDSLIAMLYKSLLRQEDPRISAYLVDEVRKQPMLYETVALGLLSWKQPVEEELKQLLVLPANPKDRRNRNRIARGKVFTHFAHAGAKDMGTEFGRAEAQGVEVFIRSSGGYSHNLTGLQWLLVEDPNAQPGPHAHGYTEEQLGSIVRDYLITSGASSWKTLIEILQRSQPHQTHRATMAGREISYSYKLSDPVLARMIQALPQAPRGGPMQRLVNSLSSFQVKKYPSVRGLWLWMLQDEDPWNQWRALSSLRVSDFPDLGDRCLTALGSKSPEVQITALRRLAELHYATGFDRATPLVRSEDSQVRARAVTTLVAIDQERGLPAVLPMIRDSSSGVRLSVIRACRSSLDPSVTGTLLIGLQDGTKAVREAAQAALDAIRFYHEQKSFWDAWNKRSKLGYANPAAALLAQAQNDQPQKIRIQAIRSLGTLGDTGSLPFLIQLMKDGNAEIQKAAEQALDRINAKK